MLVLQGIKRANGLNFMIRVVPKLDGKFENDSFLGKSLYFLIYGVHMNVYGEAPKRKIGFEEKESKNTSQDYNFCLRLDLVNIRSEGVTGEDGRCQ